MQAGRELDALVSAHVFGLPVLSMDEQMQKWGGAIPNAVNCRVKNSPGEREWDFETCAHYSTDMNAAWQVVEKMREQGFYYVLTTDDDEKQHECFFALPDTHMDEVQTVMAEQASHAICLAALKAMEVA